MWNNKKNILFVIIFVVASYSSNSQEFSQWRGDDRSGVYNEKNILTNWPEGGPKLLWHAEGLPKGYSSMAIANNMVYFTGLQDSADVVVAVDFSGQKKWQTVIGKSWVWSFPDSRCTPTIEGDRVYVSSGTGDVVCVNAFTGETIWRVDAVGKFKGRFSSWGCAESILIFEDKVFFTTAGDQTTMVALNKLTGETVWTSKSLNDTMAYASPILAQLGERKLIFNTLANHLIGVDPATGDILCHFNYGGFHNKTANKDWGGASYCNTNTPVIKGNSIYITGGYNHVGVKLKLSDDLTKLDVEWIDSTLDVHHGGTVLLDGYIYGANWINNGNGNWCCIDWETGKTLYETKWKSKGSIIANDGYLYCYEERTGWIALVKATPEGFNPSSSFKVPYGTGPYWAHLAIRNGVLYVRHGDSIMAYSISEK